MNNVVLCESGSWASVHMIDVNKSRVRCSSDVFTEERNSYGFEGVMMMIDLLESRSPLGGVLHT